MTKEYDGYGTPEWMLALTAKQWEELEHVLYLSLLGPLESYLDMDPCPATKLAETLAWNAIVQMREANNESK